MTQQEPEQVKGQGYFYYQSDKVGLGGAGFLFFLCLPVKSTKQTALVAMLTWEPLSIFTSESEAMGSTSLCDLVVDDVDHPG